jgi:hypothetical protein
MIVGDECCLNDDFEIIADLKMSKRHETIGYLLAFLAVCGFLLGWKLLVAPERSAYIAEYQKRLHVTAENVSASAVAESPDESLRIYAVHVVDKRAFKSPSIAYGIYLGQGLVLTAAHVVGRYPFATSPHVLIAGEDLPAKVIKEGSPDQTDLALLAVDQQRLPVSLGLRRTPLCKGNLQIGMNVIIVYPERTTRSRVISPLLIAAQLRPRFNTLVNEAEAAGSGVFSADRKCLLGIMSRGIEKFAYGNAAGRMTIRRDGYAGYFVPVLVITNFAPQVFGL